VQYGAAMAPEEVRKMTDHELACELARRICKMQNECRTEHGKEPFDYDV